MIVLDEASQLRIQTVCLMTLTAAVIGFLIYWLSPVLIPFVVALFVVSGLTPLLQLLERKLRVGRLVAAAVAFVLGFAAFLMIFAAAFAFFDGFQAVGVGILRGLQDVNIPTLITIVVYWVINLPLGYALGFPLGFGITGIWLGFVVSLMLASGFLSWRFYNLTGRLIRQKVVQQVITADTTSTAPILPAEIPTQEPTPSG